MTTVRFDVTPVFPDKVWGDDAGLKEALDMVLKARNKKDDDGLLFKALLQSGATRVGDLRRLSDQDWRELELPAICRIYLKYLIRQAGRIRIPEERGESRWLTKLEQDFNQGKAFDMGLYEPNIYQLQQLGFSAPEAMEALCITRNQLQEAIELCLTSPAIRAEHRAEAVARGDPVAQQLVALTKQLGESQVAYARSEQELKLTPQKITYNLYRGYVMGIVASGEVTPSELECLKTFREANMLTEKDHTLVLSDLNITLEKWNKMKVGEAKREKECVVCLERGVNQVIFDCMHVCMCEVCVPTVVSCPICGKKIRAVKKVYF